MLVIISTALIVGSFLPKIDYLTTRELEQFKTKEPYYYWLAAVLSPSRVVKSYPFFIVWALLLNSTVVCTYRRLKGHLKLKKTGTRLLEGGLKDARHSFEIKTNRVEVLQTIKSHLKGWQIAQNEEGTKIRAQRGGQGFWGSIIFHAGLISLFLGAGISGVTRYDASFLITENQSVYLPDIVMKTEQQPIINLNSKAIDAIINLKNIDAKYGKFEQLTDIKADFAIAGLDNTFSKDVVGVNKPMYFKNIKVVIEKYGIAPTFAIKDNEGKIIDNFQINLGDWLPESWTEKGTFDSFEIPNSNLLAKVFFIPNYKKVNGKVVSQGRLVKNPAFIIKFLDKKTLKEKTKGLVQKGQGAKFGDKQLVFQTLDYWGFFRMSKDSGVPIIIISLLLGVTGLAIRFIYHEKTVWFELQESGLSTSVKIGGKSKYFPALFDDEIKNISDKIEDELKPLRGQNDND